MFAPEDSYTTDVSAERLARIPAVQAAARRVMEQTEDCMDVNFARGIDAALSWLDSEVAPEIFKGNTPSIEGSPIFDAAADRA